MEKVPYLQGRMTINFSLWGILLWGESGKVSMNHGPLECENISTCWWPQRDSDGKIFPESWEKNTKMFCYEVREERERKSGSFTKIICLSSRTMRGVYVGLLKRRLPCQVISPPTARFQIQQNGHPAEFSAI